MQIEQAPVPEKPINLSSIPLIVSHALFAWSSSFLE